MFTELTEDNLDQILHSNEKVMVQYGAAWCGNCKITKPKFKRMAEENPDIAFYYVDAEKLPESRKFADVTNLPTFAGFVNGQLVKQAQGNKVETIQEVKDAVTGN
ncbi:MAG: thioredoxin family protein [Flavobacteriia bacterium]|nr:thioredoxin family protein [Flavobacteriia bacterium]OJX36897.1 MAG: thiol reductase thioredoxin [Flavobacteriia bacterium 40-80]